MKKLIKYSLFLMLSAGLLFQFSCDKDEAPSFDVGFANTTLSFSESAGSVQVTVNMLSGAQSDPVIISYSLGGTAVQGTDYNLSGSGSLTVPANALSASITLDLIDNLEEDGEKSIVVNITNVSINGENVPQTSGGQSITIVISDDECSPYIAGTWNYTAKYWSFAPPGSDTEVQTGQDGQGLPDEDGDGEPDVSPEFMGTTVISDSLNNRAYFIDDAAFGQFAALGLGAPGPLLDNCGTLSVPPGEVLLAGAFEVTLNGTINEDGSISVEWFYVLPDGSGAKVGRGEATLSR